MMKKNTQIITFKVSLLSTLLMYTTANNYASDIEIYRAPTLADGNAKIMFVLDVSTYMYQNPRNSGGSGGGSSGIESVSPIEADYGLHSCTVGSETRYADTTYKYTASYCETPVRDASAAVQAGCFTSITRPNASPLIPVDTYRCYDRLSNLKEALFEVVDDPAYSAEAAATDSTGKTPKISLGFSFYPTSVAAFSTPLEPQLLNAAGRTTLKNRISDAQLPPPETNMGGKDAQVAQAYGRGVQSLIAAANGDSSTARQCSGYGVYMVSGRNPEGDVLAGTIGAYGLLTNSLNLQTKAKDPLNSTCNFTTNSSSNGMSWRCVEKAAELLMAGTSVLNMPIRTAVVSMGKGIAVGRSFAFYDVDSRTDFQKYETKFVNGEKVSTTVLDIDKRYAEIKAQTNIIGSNNEPLLNDRRYALRTGIAGDGGYFSVSNTADLKKSIRDFIVKTLEVDIPYITTGAPTIPQDPLNPAIVQDNAYYSQFKPTPTVVDETSSSLWAGNLKKYRIGSGGELRDKSNNLVLDSLGRLAEGTHDFWASPVSSDETIIEKDENTPGSELFARMGGVKSQLDLLTIVTNATTGATSTTGTTRKLLTNRVVTGEGATATVSEGTTLNQIDTTNDPKKDDLHNLLQLRQVGAVMHSAPLLLTNKGRTGYDAVNKKIITENREDYILFGSTQGLLHVVRAKDYLDADGSSAGGKEVFAFVPNEMIENQSKAFLSADKTAGGTANLFYGVDAPWTAYTEYVPDSDGNLTVGTGKELTDGTSTEGKQLVYGGLRMGGRSYYALDLHDMSDPALKFHINPADRKVYFNNTSKTYSELQYMGQSWSKPKIEWVSWKGQRKLVMFVGGGYDAGYENESYAQVSKNGAGVYMFDALNGDLLWWASANAAATSSPTTNSGVIALKDPNLQYSVVSEIKTTDRNNDGLVDHLYFGDLAGQVFRIDLNNAATTSGSFATRAVRLLNLHKDSGLSPRFYAAPAFSTYKDVGGDIFAVISIGSGNLSHPLAEYMSTSGRDYDALYNIYDKDVARVDLYTATTLYTQDKLLSDLGEITSNNRFANDRIVAPYATTDGWYYRFKGGSKVQNEKLFYSPTVIDYDLYINSYDSSRLGLTGQCGGGVQGVSKVRVFCMPFGQCAASRGFTSEDNASDEQGAGILNHAIGGTDGGETRLLAGGGSTIDNNLQDHFGAPVQLIARRWYER